ncbi:uncharacterized protein RB166_010982 [Leptodactylus fuscus]
MDLLRRLLVVAPVLLCLGLFILGTRFQLVDDFGSSNAPKPRHCRENLDKADPQDELAKLQYINCFAKDWMKSHNEEENTLLQQKLSKALISFGFQVRKIAELLGVEILQMLADIHEFSSGHLLRLAEIKKKSEILEDFS